MYCAIKINGRNVIALPDSGSDVSIISATTAKAIKLNYDKVQLSIKPFASASVTSIGTVSASLIIGNSEFKCAFIIISGSNESCILGCNFLSPNKLSLDYATEYLLQKERSSETFRTNWGQGESQRKRSPSTTIRDKSHQTWTTRHALFPNSVQSERRFRVNSKQRHVCTCLQRLSRRGHRCQHRNSALFGQLRHDTMRTPVGQERHSIASGSQLEQLRIKPKS